MSYQLGSITLPKPKSFVRNIVEYSVEHLLMFGLTTKRVTNRKEQFVLQYMYLTPADISSILSQYELDTVLTFVADEGNLDIPATDVLMDVQGLDYPPSGKEWRGNMQIILTEVL